MPSVSANLKKMAMNLSTAHNRLKRAEHHTERVVGTGVAVLEETTAALGAGYVAGRYGMYMLPGGIPADAGIGAALVIGGILELAGKHSHHLASFGSGLLASAATRWGMQLGQQGARQAQAQGQVSGMGLMQAAHQFFQGAPGEQAPGQQGQGALAPPQQSMAPSYMGQPMVQTDAGWVPAQRQPAPGPNGAPPVAGQVIDAKSEVVPTPATGAK